MAEPYCTVAVCLSTADRGRTILQWRVSPELAHLFIADFNERFGEPCGEGTASGEDVDAVVAALNATGSVQLYLGLTMDAAAELTRDLYANLVEQLYAVPAPRRRRSCWVMNQEWFDECRKIGGWPEAACTTMLGLPYVVTEDGGYPHLIAD